MKVIVQNLATEYLDEGSGSIILLLHGWQDNLHTFDALSPKLSKEFRVVRLDMPGFGKTELPKDAWNLSDYIQFVHDFIVKLNLNIAVLLGHSFGGRVIIKGLATNKLQADKLVLIGSAGIAKTKTLRTTFTRILTKIGSIVMYIPPLLFWRKQLRKKLYYAIGSDYLNAGPLQKTFLKIINEDLSSFAATIKQPTLLIWGANDEATPLTDGQKLHTLISQSQLQIFPDAGHFVHQEKTSEVVKTIKAFLC